MSDLNQESRELLLAACDDFDKEPVDSARILAAVLAKAAGPGDAINPAAGSSGTLAEGASSVTRIGAFAKFATAGVLVTALVTGVYLLAIRTTPTPDLEEPARAPRTLREDTQTVSAPAVPATISVPNAQPLETRASATPQAPSDRRPQERRSDNAIVPSDDALREEARLLLEARNALRASDAQRAIAVLDRVQQQFPRGVLREESDATRVMALCALARVDEATGIARRFVRLYPGSPLRERVENSCVGAALTP